MSLKYVILAALLEGESSGYDLAKQFDRSIANFWHATPQQLYAELARLADDGLVSATTVLQERRPNKRLVSLTDTGRADLARWAAEPSRPPSIKDEVTLKVYAADLVDPEVVLDRLRARRDDHAAKLRYYGQVQHMLLADRSEEEYLRESPRIGVYLALRRGILFEQSGLEWCEWAMGALQVRSPARDASPSPAMIERRA